MTRALRTQIYLTADQRKALDDMSRREDASLAELIRTAVDEFLAQRPLEVDDALDQTFGTVPEAQSASRNEWRLREARLRG